MSSISLAREVEAGTDATVSDAARYLTFTLNGEAYALNIFNVTEILEYRQLTVVPMMPEFIRGVINLRGRAVPVIDLAVRFARGATTVARRTSIIIVHITDAIGNGITGQPGIDDPGGGQRGQDVGILVDSVNKVEAFTDDDIEPPPAFGAGIRTDYMSGMARRENDFIIVLDIDHVLTLDDINELLGTATGAFADGGDGKAATGST